MKGIFKLGAIITTMAMLNACSGMVTIAERDDYAQPKWYANCAETGTEGWFWWSKDYYYACGSAVSGFKEAAYDKSLQLAKTKIADRINGAVNKRTTIEYNDSGSEENLVSSTQSQVLVVNKITDTVVSHYSSNEGYLYKRNGKYHHFIMLKLDKEIVDQLVAEAQNLRASKIKIDTNSINKSAKQVD